MTSSLALKQIGHRFAEHEVLSNIELDIAAGEFIVLLGPSGCGKTTLLMIIAGFLIPSQGQVLIGNKDITNLPPSKRPTTTMFQDYALFPHMTVATNIGFGLKMRGMRRAERNAKADELLKLVGLPQIAQRKPHELSGGQRQRVALARALAIEPDVLLLDEPLGALDLKLRRQMQDELKALQQRIGTTFIHVTHDQEEAMAIADKIVVMDQGKIVDFGTTDAVYLRPKTLFSASFMGDINLIPATVKQNNSSSLSLQTDLGAINLAPTNAVAEGLKANDTVTLTIRPEHFFIEQSQTTIGSETLCTARVLDNHFFGSHCRCYLQPLNNPEIKLLAHLPQTTTIRNDDVVTLQFNVDLARVLTH